MNPPNLKGLAQQKCIFFADKKPDPNCEGVFFNPVT